MEVDIIDTTPPASDGSDVDASLSRLYGPLYRAVPHRARYEAIARTVKARDAAAAHALSVETTDGAKGLAAPLLPQLLSDGLVLYAIGEMPPDSVALAYQAPPSDHPLLPALFYPLGYVAVRLHQSFVQPGRVCQYKCEIFSNKPVSAALVDSAGARVEPVFVVTCEDDVSHPVIAPSAQLAWQEVAQRISRTWYVATLPVRVSLCAGHCIYDCLMWLSLIVCVPFV